VSFASLTTPEVDDLIDRFANAGEVTLIVGAGASMEASLPSWSTLIERLLRRIAADHPLLSTPELKEEWIASTLRHEDLLAAGAIVEVLAPAGLPTLLPEELFGEDGPAAYEPGPIGREVANLRARFGRRLTILTTNYDDLIERALLASGIPAKNIKSYVRRTPPPPESVAVTHLHGYAGRVGKPRRIVLTEEHYHRMQRGSSWQEEYVTDRLENSVCLFIGTSLSDPNLIRYLYGYKQTSLRRHAAVFVRQAELEGAHEAVRAVREEAASKRWEGRGVSVIFVDHFADAAQLLYEIGHRLESGTTYEPVGARASVALRRIEETALLLAGTDEAFGRRQVELSRWLRDTLQRTLRSTLGIDAPAGERLALTLWLLGRDGRTLTAWAHSDRAHQDPTTIEAVSMHPSSTWVAVRTVCQGVRVEFDRHSDISRWRFVRGLPLVIEEPSRLPIGCLTIASTRPGDETVLVSMSSKAKAAFHEGLVDAVQPELARVAGPPQRASRPIRRL